MADIQTKHRGQSFGLLGLVALGSMLWALFLTRTLADTYVLVLLALALGGIGYYFATNVGDLREQFTGKGSFYRVITTVVGALLVVVLAAANYIAVKKPVQIDLTKDKVYSLSTQTVDTLKGLKREIKIRAFYSPLEPEHRELEDKMRQYRQHTDKLVLELLDPSKHREEVRAENITLSSPRIIVKLDGKESRAKDPSEESITNAIVEVTRGVARKVYFTKGHGEKPVGDNSERGLRLFTEALKNENFQLDDILLATVKEIPKDASIVVVAGPAAALLESETKLLKEWVDKGGKLVALVDPAVQSGMEKMLEEMGIVVGNDEVIDPESQNPELAIGQTFTEHPLNKQRQAAGSLPLLLPLARSVSKAKVTVAGWSQTELVKTGASAWGETELTRDAPVKFDPGKDTPGPVSLAVAATKGSGDSESRVLVVGNSSFLTNNFYRLWGNRDFALNAIAWASKDESKITIRPNKRQGKQTLVLTAEQKKGMFLFALNLLPFTLLAVGLLVWQTRRSR